MAPGDKSWSAQQRGPGGRGLKVCYVIGLRRDGSQRQSTSGREGVGDRLPATIQARGYFIVRRSMTASLFMGEGIRTRWFP